MTANPLIEVTLKEIGQRYQPGTLAWMKMNRPDEWRKMLTIERKVNELAVGSNLEGFREALGEYQRLIISMVTGFKAIKENRRQEAFDFDGSKRGGGTTR